MATISNNSEAVISNGTAHRFQNDGCGAPLTRSASNGGAPDRMGGRNSDIGRSVLTFTSVTRQWLRLKISPFSGSQNVETPFLGNQIPGVLRY